MAADDDDDDFSSFRDRAAELDPAARRRIRARFEELRDGGAADDEILTLVPATAGGDVHRASRRMVLAGIAAAVALVALVVGTRLVGDDTRLRADLDLTLEQLADEVGSDTPLDDGEVLYLKTRLGQRNPASGELAPALLVNSIERWEHADGSGIERSTSEVIAEGPGQVPSVAAGVQETRVTEPRPFFDTMPYDELRSLPTTPEGLLEAARRIHPAETPADLADWLSRVLALGVTPPDVRAAALEALRDVGAREMGAITDESGRRLLAFGDDGAAPSWMIVIDPGTTRTAAFARGIGPPDAPIVGADRWIEYLDQRVETELPA